MHTHSFRHAVNRAAIAFASLGLCLPALGAEPGTINPAPNKPTDFLEQTGLTPLDTDAGPAEATYTRTFRVEPGSLFILTGMPGASVTQPQDALDTFLVAHGVDAKFFYNDRTGALVVRGTLRELDQVETALAKLAISPPQVRIEMRLAEFNADAIDEELADALGLKPQARFLTANMMPALSIHTESKTRLLIRALEQKEGVDFVSAPKITTLSGRQARISIEESAPTITDPPFTAPGKATKAK